MTSSSNTIFMLGIAGTGMRGLAYLLHQKGHSIIGSDESLSLDAPDTTLSFATLVLDKDAKEYIPTATLFIYSDAVPADHPFRVLADNHHIPQQSYQEALGVFAKQYTTLAVTGTHGKSTTTAMLAHVFIEAGLDPTVLVGAGVPAFAGRNAQLGKSPYFIIEADEYREHFLELSPTHAIITTIEYDHPDFFTSEEMMEQSYSKFIQSIPLPGHVVVLESTYRHHDNITWPADARLILVNDTDTSAISLRVPGEHMKRNAALVLELATKFGMSREDALHHLASFPGINRRMESLGTVSGIEFFSDYGHHPTEIAATLEGARQAYPNKKIAVLFEAHMVERLTTFKKEFITALSKADRVVVCPVFMPKGRAHGAGAAQEEFYEVLIQTVQQATLLPAYEELAATLSSLKGEYDIAIAFTAGVLDGKLRSTLLSFS